MKPKGKVIAEGKSRKFKYKLIAAEVPPREWNTGYKGNGCLQLLLKDFVASKEKSVVVDSPSGHQPGTLAHGLKQACESTGLVGLVNVYTRKGEVYIERS